MAVNCRIASISDTRSGSFDGDVTPSPGSAPHARILTGGSAVRRRPQFSLLPTAHPSVAVPTVEETDRETSPTLRRPFECGPARRLWWQPGQRAGHRRHTGPGGPPGLQLDAGYGSGPGSGLG